MKKFKLEIMKKCLLKVFFLENRHFEERFKRVYMLILNVFGLLVTLYYAVSDIYSVYEYGPATRLDKLILHWVSTIFFAVTLAFYFLRCDKFFTFYIFLLAVNVLVTYWVYFLVRFDYDVNGYHGAHCLCYMYIAVYCTQWCATWFVNMIFQVAFILILLSIFIKEWGWSVQYADLSFISRTFLSFVEIVPVTLGMFLGSITLLFYLYYEKYNTRILMQIVKAIAFLQFDTVPIKRVMEAPECQLSDLEKLFRLLIDNIKHYKTYLPQAGFVSGQKLKSSSDKYRISSTIDDDDDEESGAEDMNSKSDVISGSTLSTGGGAETPGSSVRPHFGSVEGGSYFRRLQNNYNRRGGGGSGGATKTKDFLRLMDSFKRKKFSDLNKMIWKRCSVVFISFSKPFDEIIDEVRVNSDVNVLGDVNEFFSWFVESLESLCGVYNGEIHTSYRNEWIILLNNLRKCVTHEKNACKLANSLLKDIVRRRKETTNNLIFKHAQLRISIMSGKILSCFVGSAGRKHFQIFGEKMEMLRMLNSNGVRENHLENKILVDEDVYREVKYDFSSSLIDYFRLKKGGKNCNCHIYSLRRDLNTETLAKETLEWNYKLGDLCDSLEKDFVPGKVISALSETETETEHDTVLKGGNMDEFDWKESEKQILEFIKIHEKGDDDETLYVLEKIRRRKRSLVLQ